MFLLASFCVQIAGSYTLYCASERAVFEKKRLSRWLFCHPYVSRLLGYLMVLGSLVMFLREMGTTVGLLFALISLMTISGFMIILVPLKKA